MNGSRTKLSLISETGRLHIPTQMAWTSQLRSSQMGTEVFAESLEVHFAKLNYGTFAASSQS